MRISLFAALALGAALSAQSPLTTLFAGNNSGSAGGTVMFDLTVNTQITITQFDVNTISGAGINGTLEIRTCPTSYIGNEMNAGAWTTQSSGNALVTAAANAPTVCTLTTPVTLPPGTYGMMLKADTWQHYYTNGTGTNQNFSTAEVSVALGAAQNVEYTAPFSPRVANFSMYYTAGAGFATKRPYGEGCIRRAGTVHEFFAAAASFDLSGSSMTLIYNGSSGYVAVPGLTPYAPPGGGAQVLALTDDSEVAVGLASPLPTPSGSTSSLTVCSNGFISVATGNGVAFTPNEAAFFNFPQTVWSSWHDYNPSAGGAVRFEQVGTRSIVTWDNVPDFGGTVGNTLQFQFDRASGNVDIIWQSITGAGNAHLVGFKCGGAVLPVTSVDLSALLPTTFNVGCDTRPIDFDASARPVLGTNINLVTTRIPAGATLAVHRLTFTAISPGFSLTPLGAPGCFAHVDIQGPDNLFLGVTPAGTSTSLLALPNNPAFAGTRLVGQSAVFVPGINALGLITSNGLELNVNIN